MDVENKTKLSAMFDGEASDLEERRFLRDHDPADSARTLARWESIRQVVRGEQASTLSDAQQAALFERIHSAIDQETAPESLQVRSLQARKGFVSRRPVAFAAAASVLLLAGIGFMVPQLQNPNVVGEAKNLALNEPSTRDVLTVAYDQRQSGLDDLDEVDTNPDLRALDDAGRAKLRAYLQQHDRLSQSGSRQAFVNFPKSKSPQR